MLEYRKRLLRYLVFNVCKTHQLNSMSAPFWTSAAGLLRSKPKHNLLPIDYLSIIQYQRNSTRMFESISSCHPWHDYPLQQLAPNSQLIDWVAANSFCFPPRVLATANYVSVLHILFSLVFCVAYLSAHSTYK